MTNDVLLIECVLILVWKRYIMFFYEFGQGRELVGTVDREVDESAE